jgi:hypothetical protein
MGANRIAYRFVVEKAEGKGPFGRSGCRGDNDIKMNLKEIGWEGVD